jgi:hypothetical protein
MRTHDTVRGFRHQYWRIQEVRTHEVISEQWLPAEDVSIVELRDLLERAARRLITPRQARTIRLWKMRDVTGDGPRVAFKVGVDPCFIASLWREDEVPTEQKRRRLPPHLDRGSGI